MVIIIFVTSFFACLNVITFEYQISLNCFSYSIFHILVKAGALYTELGPETPTQAYA